MVLEICVDSLDQTKAAIKYGASRIELCSALDLGGLTPSFGLTKQCNDLSQVEVHVMIRPRGGGFVYSSNEVQCMKVDIQSLGNTGAKGVVFGILDKNGSINYEINNRLLDLAKSLNLEVTFHRAFDFVKDPEKSLDQLIKAGFDRVLTSGQENTAIQGIDLIKQMVTQSLGRIEIMAGGGVNGSNIEDLYATGIDAIHFTARKPIPQTKDLGMGREYVVDTDKLNYVAEVMNKLKL